MILRQLATIDSQQAEWSISYTLLPQECGSCVSCGSCGSTTKDMKGLKKVRLRLHGLERVNGPICSVKFSQEIVSVQVACFHFVPASILDQMCMMRLGTKMI